MRWPALVLLTVAVAGCGAVSDDAQRSSLAALETQEPKPGPGLLESMILGAIGPSPLPPGCERDPYRSARPARLPRPGHMPAGSVMKRIQRRGRLVAGVDQNTLGLGYFNPINQTIRGFDIELIREVVRAIFGEVTSKNLRYKAISTNQRESVVVNGDVDIVASAFSITCERRRRLAFSSVYYRARQRLLVPTGSPVTRLAHLKGRKVCATKGSTSITRLEGTGVVPFGVDLRPDCLVALQEGEVDAVTSDDAILLGYSRQDPQARIVGTCMNLERYGLAMSKRHPELVRFVNGVLAKLRREGELRRMREHWLPGLQKPPGGGTAKACAKR